MIGDSTYDLQMAKNAGVSSLAVSYGVQRADKLQAHEPLGCVNSFPEVMQWLKSNTIPNLSA